MTQSKKWLLGGIIIIGCVTALAMLSIKEFSVYFYTPSEAVEMAHKLTEKEIRIGGMVKNQSVHFNTEALELNFILTDLKGTEIAVSHKGTPPDMFKENSGVVVEGWISADGKSVKSKHLLAKHSEEYRVIHDPNTMNTELLKQSLFGQTK